MTLFDEIDLDRWALEAGGYRSIDWTRWDAAVAESQRRHREGLAPVARGNKDHAGVTQSDGQAA